MKKYCIISVIILLGILSTTQIFESYGQSRSRGRAQAKPTGNNALAQKEKQLSLMYKQTNLERNKQKPLSDQYFKLTIKLSRIAEVSAETQKQRGIPPETYNKRYQIALDILVKYVELVNLDMYSPNGKVVDQKIKELRELLGIKEEPKKDEVKIDTSKPVEKKPESSTGMGLTVGAKGGMNYTSNTSPGAKGGVAVTYGALVEYSLTSFDDFIVGAGLNVFYVDTKWENDIGKLKADYLRLPVYGMIKYDMKSIFMPYFFAGPIFDFLLTANYTNKELNNTYKFTDKYRGNNISLQFGLGGELKFDFGTPFIELGYCIGLTPVSNNIDVYASGVHFYTKKSENSNIIIYAGYKLSF